MNATPFKRVSFRNRHLAPEDRPAPYRFFQRSPNGIAIVLQTHDPESYTITPATALAAYRTRCAIGTPWGIVRTGSTMLLSEHAARHMLAAGSLEVIPEQDFPRRSKPSPGRAEP